MTMQAKIDAWSAQTEYACEYTHNGTRWATSIFAIDDNDAKLKIENLKKSIVLGGPITMRIPWDGTQTSKGDDDGSD